MGNEKRILLFGDQATNLHENLQRQLRAGRTNLLLSHFLERTSTALKHEITYLPPSDQAQIPGFVTIEELIDRSQSSASTHQGITNALLCVLQLVEFIEYAGDLNTRPCAPSNTSVIGLGTGLLVGAAVSSAPVLPALIPLGVEVVIIAFRLGLYVQRVAERLELPRNDHSYWSRRANGVTESESLKAISLFNKQSNTPKSNQAYISNYNYNSTTISGPPSILKNLFENSDVLRTDNSSDNAILGPAHAPHLHGDVDLHEFLPAENPALLDRYVLSLPLLSSSSGAFLANDLAIGNGFLAAIEDILRRPLRFDRILDTLSATAKASSSTYCLVSCAFSGAESDLLKALESETGSNAYLYEPRLQPQSLHGHSKVPRRSKKAKLAIVGMAGRFPNAADHEKFWNLLEAGLDVHRKVPKDRFDVNKHYDPTGKMRNTSHTPFGCFIDEPGLFDPRFFNMSPREATQTDPMHRLGLASAYEALEMAGYVPNRTSSTKLDRIGTFYGQTSDDWREINAAQDIDTYFITGGVRAFAPGRINYYFKFSGPSFSVDTACSSSMAAIQLACTSLWASDCDTAVAGGLNVMTNSDIFAGLSRGQFLSKTGNCQTYDNDADGYCRGDGIGTLIIKRLEDAEIDNDRILGVILETATNHSANAISITHPHAPTQETLFQKVVDEAGVDPHDVDYVEMHGTGTQAGDGTEMRSVTNVFAPASRKGTRKLPLHLGSVKANVGHGEAVSGVTALIKCLLMMQKNQIPPHCGIKKTINQGFPQDLTARNVHIAYKTTPFHAKGASPRRIFVNNFSAAGGNTAMLLEDAPTKGPLRDDPRSSWVVAVSARSKTALRANMQRLIQFIDNTPDLRVADLAYTTTARRIQHNYRIAVECDSIDQAREKLASAVDNEIDPVPSTPPKVAFVFTGQGSHYEALGRQLFESSTKFRSDILGFNSIAVSQGFPSFLPLIEGEGAIQDLSPIALQLGLTCIQMALAQLWVSWGVKPQVVLGHSLGEYAALHSAGVISASSAIYLVGTRAKLLQEKCTPLSHAMLAAKAPAELVMKNIAQTSGVEVACINAPKETVLSGTVSDIDMAASKLSAMGIKSTKLNVQYAFHSSQVEPILPDFREAANTVTFNKPAIPVISPLLAGALDDSETISGEYLARHARGTVNFSGGIASAKNCGMINEDTVWLEIGPHAVCSSFIKAELGLSTSTFSTLRKDSRPYKVIADSLAGLHISGITVEWNEFHRDYIDCVQVLDLPAYAFDNKNYWIQYTGDWNLTKGQKNNTAATLETVPSSLSTTSVQKIISENVDKDKATIVVESDVSRPDLLTAVSGHVVNGTALCPSSLYADMAYTVGEYLYKLVKPEDKNVHMDVCNMEVFKSFIADTSASKSQILRLSASADLSTATANLLFSSGSGKATVEHAKCCIKYGSEVKWLAEWQRSAYLIQGRIESLQKAASAGTAHRMLRGMAYKLFASFVDYDKRYRGMEDVILDSPQLEATSQVVFQTSEADGNFVCSPYWIDSVCHLAGFIVNANDALDSGAQVFISHGWESMRFAEALSPHKTYRSYVKMQSAGNKMVSGDVYIFDGDRIVGLVVALKFQCIPRQLLNTLLPPKNSGAQQVSVKRDQQPQTKLIPSRLSLQESRSKSLPEPRFSKEADSNVTVKVLDIIASELGVGSDELTGSVQFADLGVDSLMALSITGRMREELDLQVQSSLFTDFPTVKNLQGYLNQQHMSENADASTDGTLTPDVDSDDESSSGESTAASSSSGSITSVETPSDRESLSTIVRETISREMGVEVAELLATDNLGSLGMDSLMSLSILGVLRETTGLPLSATFLIDNHSIKAIEKSLNIGDTIDKPSLKPKIKQPPAPQATKSEAPERFASSVLLQGNPKLAKKNFWLVPDGSGSATSYIFMPEISRKVAVWGLNSPYMKTPEEYKGGVPGMAAKFISEIKRRQPEGPYFIGGWSAGGVISFEVTRQLIEAGDIVDVLVLIDTPCPLIIEPLPSSLHRFFGSIGLLGEGDGALEKLPAWLLPHFAASVQALSSYEAKRIDPAKCPKVMAIWCEDGVCKYPEDPRPDPYPYGHAQWLLENRSDFGPNLWDEYLEESKITTRQMEGNHFSMMRDPQVKKLTGFLQEALLS
ncbi:MAG: hypothetical protein Q9167_004420 [Letrouitia subvulpina]